MVTLQKVGNSMNREVLEITGLSTDEKPIDFINFTYITNGSTFEEIDTGTIYKYDEDAKEWVEQPVSGGSGGNISLDYSALTNKPQIGGKELVGNKTLDDLGIQPKGTYLTKETDPTVPAWAKTEAKPTYTADEVGALPKTTTTLPNPKKIKFTGAVTDDYDGSVEKTINIPTGSSYTLPQATDKILGGIKAKGKTNETVEVAIDTATGKLFVPTINIPTGSSYTLPQATDKILGGIKAKGKTNETVEVAIDTATGKLFVPTYPTGIEIELDKTLAVEGKAADAKAVGDALKTKIGSDALAPYMKTVDADKKYALKTELPQKGVAVADAGDADVKDKLNALLVSLRDAGIIAQ